MIARLKGTLVQKGAADLVIDVNGVGYAVAVPATTIERLSPPGGEITLLTHLHVREDALQLYGFLTEGDRDFFKLLLGVSGIGPKMAMSVLSRLSAPDAARAIAAGDVRALTGIPGVGRKTAERIVMELRDRLGPIQADGAPDAPATSKQLRSRSEAIVALMSLGHTRAAAEQALRNVLLESAGEDLPVEELIRKALRFT